MLMVKRSKSRSDEWAPPLFSIIGAITAIVGCFWLLLFDLSRPTIYPNLGLAAYTPPPGTRLLPLPRKSGAQELADLPDEPPSPLTALAQAKANEKPVKVDSPTAARKHVRAAPREYDQRTLGYAQEWNYGQSDWNSNRAWSGRRNLTGGPES